MNRFSDHSEVVVICAIVNCGVASKLTKSAKRHGISGATITIGRGTINNRILDFMGLADIRKEIVYMAAEKETADRVLEQLNREFEFHKPHHGIAFTTSVCGISGTKRIVCTQQNDEERGAETTMYHIITAIVDKGKAEDVITAATAAGSKGGTILNARGSGIHETSKLFAMEIEPEKELVLILSERDMTKMIVNSIREKLKLDEPGNGIIYIQSAVDTYGIYK